jgi:hypothetical protein
MIIIMVIIGRTSHGLETQIQELGRIMAQRMNKNKNSSLIQKVAQIQELGKITRQRMNKNKNSPLTQKMAELDRTARQRMNKNKNSPLSVQYQPIILLRIILRYSSQISLLIILKIVLLATNYPPGITAASHQVDTHQTIERRKLNIQLLIMSVPKDCHSHSRPLCTNCLLNTSQTQCKKPWEIQNGIKQ